MAKRYTVYGFETIPEISQGSDLSQIIFDAAEREGVGFRDNDLVIVSSKAAAKSMGRYVDLSTVRPSGRAMAIYRLTGKDARRVQLILEECKQVLGYFSTRRLARDEQFLHDYFGGAPSAEVLKRAEAVLLTEMSDGSLSTGAATDHSNMPSKDILCLLPRNPKRIADELRHSFESKSGCRLAVIISDSEVRMMR